MTNIRQILGRHGFRFSKSMGQNFLIERRVPEKIALAALPEAGASVLEVGPGIGCLTRELASRAGKVVSVELDRSLAPVLGETLSDLPNVELIFGDYLKLDLEGLILGRFGTRRPVFCANIPYNITGPLLVKTVGSGLFDDAVVMVQREVARRICAGAGEPDYGALTVYINWYAQPQALFDVPPGCFMPRPKVVSTVLRLTPRGSPPARVRSEKLFFRVVRAAFAQRRKTLVNALFAAFPYIPKQEIQAAVTDCGFSPAVRGEQLDIEAFALLAGSIDEKTGGGREV